MNDSELIVEAAIAAIWHLERWHDVADRLFSILITLIYVAPSHPAMDDIKFLSELARTRSMQA
ncbi:MULTISPECIES: hypothetical protein [unclassified Thiocapsa]|uniref:hypothetical protein n=1 Tax=unclassified Thiocapsa TaxID=2641286 RepID=UPI0035AFF5BE